MRIKFILINTVYFGKFIKKVCENYSNILKIIQKQQRQKR